MSDGGFSKLSDDVILSILHQLEEDPRHWARIACVSTKFASLVRTVCFRTKCLHSIPAVVSDLLPTDAPPNFWSSLYKLAVCCPGLLHSGVLVDTWDFRSSLPDKTASSSRTDRESAISASNYVWSLYDELLFDSLHSVMEIDPDRAEIAESRHEIKQAENPNPNFCSNFTICKRRKICRPHTSHLGSGVWNLSREQGNKLLASRFKGDCLYICDWPGCIHVEEKRNYMLFRGVFKNFKESRVWRTVTDGNKSKIDMNCTYCGSKQMWDLHSAFCLRRYFGFHDDGEPIVRAYVCENGHVAGAWTDWPLYT